MIPEIGQFCLVLALLIAALQAALPLAGAGRCDARWMGFARPAAFAQLFFASAAFGCLLWSFVVSDFSVRNVASHSSLSLPLGYRITATWGSHEGSMLLWVLMLAIWSAAVARFSRQLPLEMVARILGVMGLISAGFLLFLLFASNPFERLLPAPADGRELNPLLQDPAMAAHPPLLYMGYVGFSVVFAFAIAALIAGRLDSAWARWSRPWVLAAWACLTLGIVTGSWWAYYELGWGGWWFWDPVENASLMPWLIGAALIHSLAVTEKRGAFRRWTVLLAIAAFSLSLLGTFLVRSGVLSSVHAFATDPQRGAFILVLLALTVGGSLLLFALRAGRLEAAGGPLQPVCRESLLLANGVLLLVAAASVLLGTLYPLLLDALGLGKISVGPPYFEAVLAPILAPLAFLVGVGPVAAWRQAALPGLWVRLRWAFGASVVAAAAASAASGAWRPGFALGVALASWIAAATIEQVRQRAALQRADSGWRRYAAQPRAFWGMTVAHLGVAVLIAGVVTVNAWQVERDVRMGVGDAVTVGGYDYRFHGVTEVLGPNYLAARAAVEVTRNGTAAGVLYPEKRLYASQSSPMTEAAIASGPFGDRYLSLGEPAGDGAWTLRIAHKPLVTWIWAGCALMALGGLLALSDRRYRTAMVRRRDAAAQAATLSAQVSA